MRIYSQEDTVKRATTEYDRRIMQYPDQEIHYQQKVSYLFNNERYEEAKPACIKWIEAHPKSYNARVALMDIERKRRSGLDPGEKDEKWSDYPHTSFASWSIFNNFTGDSKAARKLPNVIRLPFADNKADRYIAEYCIFMAARYCSRYKDQLAIEICDYWENNAKDSKNINDASYLAIRASARLHVGEFEQALSDAEVALRGHKTGNTWDGDIKSLITAIKNQDKQYSYELEHEPYYGCKWITKSQ